MTLETLEARLGMNVFAWMRGLSMKLQEAFGCRIVFIGLQGSRARGEAHEGSDIDAVVLLDSLGAEDLVAYRGIIEAMPHSELACGFIGSADVLASWPRHELLQFYHDTVPIRGKLPEIAPFSKRDALEATHIGASGIYHAACHALAFDGGEASGILKQLFKGAFFVLQALQFARTGAYPRTRAELSEHLEGDEALVLEVGCNWEKHTPSDDAELAGLVDLLIGWAGSVMRSAGAAQDAEKRLEPYLRPTEFIDFEDGNVAEVARTIRLSASGRCDLVKRTYEYVRDQVSHSYDAGLHTPAAKASEVLRAGGGICWGKANLLSALLRANGIPSGISYQVLTKGETPDSGYMVHALNTVYVDDEAGWIRVDARGNKEGVDAQFSLDGERLAFAVRPECGERDFRDNHADADPDLMRLIMGSDDILAVSSEPVLDRWKRPL